MRRRLAAAVLLVLVVLLFSGCNGRRETDEVGYIILVGLDKAAEKGKLNVTYQIAVPRTMAGGEGGGGGEGSKGAAIITITAASLSEARNILNTSLARAPNLSHNQAFIIGEELAKDGLAAVMGPLMRYREFRGSMFMIVVQNTTAQEFMEKNSPKIEALPSKYIETMLLTNTETGYYTRSTLHEFYTRLKNGSASPYAVLAGLNPLTGEDKPSKRQVAGEKTVPYTAGNEPIEGDGTPTNFAGTAVFKQDKLVGRLTTQETRVLLMLQGDFQRGFVVVADPQLPDQAVNVLLRLGERPKIKARMADGQVTLEVELNLEAEISAIPSGINYETNDYRRQLEDKISQVITAEINALLYKTQALGSDVVGFGHHVRPLFGKYQEWRQADWEEMYRQAEIDVQVKTNIRRTGLMWQTTGIDNKQE